MNAQQLDAFETNGSSPPHHGRRFPGLFPGEYADVLVHNCGTIFLFRRLTAAAQAWVADHLPADALQFGAAVVVEHRYIADIVMAATIAGLVIR